MNESSSSPSSSSSSSSEYSEEIVHIVGTNRNERGRSCEKHPICGVVVEVGGLVRLRLVKLKRGDGREPAIEVRWVIDGEDTCRVGFLQAHYIPYAERYNGKLAKVMEVWSASDDSTYKRRMYHHNCGCCIGRLLVVRKSDNEDGIMDTTLEESGSSDSGESE